MDLRSKVLTARTASFAAGQPAAAFPRARAAARCVVGVPQRLIQVVEESRSVGEADRVVGVPLREAFQDAFDAGDFRTAEFRVLAVDVVYHFGDGHEGRIVEPEATEQGLEGAMVALVRVLRFEHVEAELAGPRAMAVRCDEAEARLGVDEPAN